jgi:hypothetical protein
MADELLTGHLIIHLSGYLIACLIIIPAQAYWTSDVPYFLDPRPVST